MRYSKLILMVLAFANASMAADRFVGTWKLSSANSKYKTGTPPKEQTLTFAETGSDLDVMLTGTTSDGKPISLHFTVPSSSGPGKVFESPYDAVSTRVPNPNERHTFFSKGGKVVYTARTKLSADGKTMTTTVKGTNPAGETVDGTNVYDKQ